MVKDMAKGIKISDLSKDFSMKSKDVIEKFKTINIEKTTSGTVSDEEFAVFMQQVTLGHQISNLEAYRKGEITIRIAGKPEKVETKAEPVAAKPAAPVAPEAPKVAEPIVDTVPSPIILEDIVAEEEKKATVFGYWVNDPERYGVAEFDKDGNCLSIEEKPEHPKSNYAVVGLYFYPNKVVNVAATIKPSARGEYEITTVNQEFLKDGELKVQTLGRGFAWLDTGTHDSLSEASTYVEVLEKRQGLKIACLEGIAYRQGWISEERMRELAKPMIKNQYGQYLLKVIDEIKETGKPNLD